MLPDADALPQDSPTPIPPRPVRRTLPAPLRRWGPLVGGLGALALAGWGESRVEAGDTANTPLLAYLLAIALFAASAWWVPRAADEEPATGPADAPLPGERRVIWLVLALGVVGAVVLNGAALVQLRADIESPSGFWLWLISLVVLLVGGIGISRRQGWAARWGQGIWPTTGWGRGLRALAVVAVLVGAAAARWIALDRVPFGLNADEGDRAALSIRLIRGTDSSGFFDIGWYYIPMPYFQILAAWMRGLGIGFVQARAFSGLCGLISVAGVMGIGLRHFGVRVGLLAGAILGGLGVALQFSRITTEANPTTTLWVISVALFLEGARSGKSWAWIGAGLAGGFSLYFYPSGRLWALFAAGWCLYLLLHGLGGRRWGILRGATLAAVAALLVIGPYFVRIADDLKMFSLRAQQTSIFDPENPTRLPYYDPHWSLPQLLQAQVIRAVGLVNQFGDNGGVWPTDKPLLAGLLAVLTLLGLGWLALRPRDPRFVALAGWFVAGSIGVVITVETPNMQRMATAVPVLALAVALTLDSLARRVEAVTAAGTVRVRRALATVSTVAVALVAAGLLVREARFYFVDYAAMDRWPAPTVLGNAVAAQGTDTLVTTLSRYAPMVNAGWVRLLAFDTPRAAIAMPGSHLPLAVPADRNLSFLVYPKQAEYLPYLQTLYPGGTLTPITHTTDGLQFSIYRVPQAAWATTQGALAGPPGSPGVPVDTLGSAPPGWNTYPSPMRWTAGLRVPEYWNYTIEIGPGPAQLTLDGSPVLTMPAGSARQEVTLALARGLHAVAYSGTLAQPGLPALFRWGAVPARPADATPLEPVRHADLSTQFTHPVGLYGVVEVATHPLQQRLDSTLAACCFAEQIRGDGHPYTITYTSTLTAPVSGDYPMQLFAQSAADLTIDGHTVIHSDGPHDEALHGQVTLTQGPHAVHLALHGQDGPGGLEWMWTPPGGEPSIVPPSALTPPAGAGVQPAQPAAVLGNRDLQPVDDPLEIIR